MATPGSSSLLSVIMLLCMSEVTKKTAQGEHSSVFNQKQFGQGVDSLLQ